MTTSSDAEEASNGLSITEVMSRLGTCWVVRTGGGQVRTVGATLQVLARLSNLRARAGRTGYDKQQGSEVAGKQAEGGRTP